MKVMNCPRLQTLRWAIDQQLFSFNRSGAPVNQRLFIDCRSSARNIWALLLRIQWSVPWQCLFAGKLNRCSWDVYSRVNLWVGNSTRSFLGMWNEDFCLHCHWVMRNRFRLSWAWLLTGVCNCNLRKFNFCSISTALEKVSWAHFQSVCSKLVP